MGQELPLKSSAVEQHIKVVFIFCCFGFDSGKCMLHATFEITIGVSSYLCTIVSFDGDVVENLFLVAARNSRPHTH